MDSSSIPPVINESFDGLSYVLLFSSILLILGIFIFFKMKSKNVSLISDEDYKSNDEEFLDTCIKNKDLEAIKLMLVDPSCSNGIKKKAQKELDMLKS